MSFLLSPPAIEPGFAPARPVLHTELYPARNNWGVLGFAVFCFGEACFFLKKIRDYLVPELASHCVSFCEVEGFEVSPFFGVLTEGIAIHSRLALNLLGSPG